MSTGPEPTLNRLVKGHPPAGVETRLPDPAPLPSLAKASSDTVDALIKNDPPEGTPPPPYTSQPHQPRASIPTIVQSHHTDNLPSSPPQIYLNLLILESSLRAQYLTLLARRRLNTFFITLLLLWNLTFTYLLFLRPREDGPGKLGGSPYWVIEAVMRLGWLSGVVAALLVKATGQWERGVRWPRKWLAITNRGLRGFNLRVVIVRRGMVNECMSYIRAIIPLGGIADGSGDWHLVETPATPTPNELEIGKAATGSIVEEDLSPSGEHLLLLLLPKNFSSEFRENWEIYRSEYWDRENERRAGLRRKVAVHKRTKAKETGGWKWWTGAWHIIPHASHHKRKHANDLEKHPAGYHHGGSGHQRSDSRQSKLSDKDSLVKASRRRSLMRDSSTHSRQSSRSSTPHYMLDGMTEVSPGLGIDNKDRVRRGSSVSSTSSARRSLRSGTGSVRRGEGLLSPLTMTDEPEPMAKERPKKEKRRSRPGTPTVSSSESIAAAAAVAADGMRIKREKER